jgi:hypothetical protein
MDAEGGWSLTPLLDAALDYHYRLHWRVFPIGGEKTPRCLWTRYRRHCPSEGKLRDWFGRGSDDTTGLAVIPGEPSGGLGIRDWDRKEAFHQWATAHATLAATLPLAETWRGYHSFFACERELYGEFPDGELRADSKHYTLLPPSAHPKGGNYAWLRPPSGPLRVLDPWEEELVPRDWIPKEGVTQDIIENIPVLHQESEGSQGWPVAVWSAVYCTLPTGPGQRNRALFRLARKLKAVPGLVNAESCEGIVELWFGMARVVVTTQDWETTWADFRHAWQGVDQPSNPGYLAQALARCQAGAGDSPAARLEQLGRELVRCSRDGTFYLSAREAAALVGLKYHLKAWRLLKQLFEVVEPGDQHLANVYKLKPTTQR